MGRSATHLATMVSLMWTCAVPVPEVRWIVAVKCSESTRWTVDAMSPLAPQLRCTSSLLLDEDISLAQPSGATTVPLMMLSRVMVTVLVLVVPFSAAAFIEAIAASACAGGTDFLTASRESWLDIA